MPARTTEDQLRCAVAADIAHTDRLWMSVGEMIRGMPVEHFHGLIALLADRCDHDEVMYLDGEVWNQVARLAQIAARHSIDLIRQRHVDWREELEWANGCFGPPPSPALIRGYTGELPPPPLISGPGLD